MSRMGFLYFLASSQKRNEKKKKIPGMLCIDANYCLEMHIRSFVARFYLPSWARANLSVILFVVCLWNVLMKVKLYVLISLPNEATVWHGTHTHEDSGYKDLETYVF